MTAGTPQTLPVHDISAAETARARSLFTAALVWLGYVAVVLHFHEHPDDAPVFWAAVVGVAILTPLFWIEGLLLGCRTGRWRSAWLSAWIPVLRVGGRDTVSGTRLWLPGFGWRSNSPQLEKELSQALSGPMIAIAILVLPVILVEFLLADRLQHDLWLARITRFATALIWWSFTIEFVLMVSITPKKLDYCKKHWLDLAVILLPFLFFLRALRLGQLLRLQNLSKTARIYKLRGVAMRTYRALLLIGFVRRLLQGTPERRLKTLRQRLADHEEQIAALQTEIAEIEAALTETPAIEAKLVDDGASPERLIRSAG